MKLGWNGSMNGSSKLLMRVSAAWLPPLRHRAALHRRLREVPGARPQEVRRGKARLLGQPQVMKKNIQQLKPVLNPFHPDCKTVFNFLQIFRNNLKFSRPMHDCYAKCSKNQLLSFGYFKRVASSFFMIYIILFSKFII